MIAGDLSERQASEMAWRLVRTIERHRLTMATFVSGMQGVCGKFSASAGRRFGPPSAHVEVGCKASGWI